MVQEIFKTRDGTQLCLHENGFGQAMLFQHGLCGDAGQPAQVFPLDAGYRCLTLECRGHGLSEAGHEAQFSIAQFTDDVAALIDAKQLGPCVVGGISMGAAIALRLAALHPEKVKALVIARPAWGVEAAPSNMQPNALVGTLLRQHPAEEARSVFEESEVARLLARDAPDNLASLRSFFKREPLATTAALLCRIAADGPGLHVDDFERIRVPVLVLGHGMDFVHPLGLARELAQRLAHAECVELTPKALDGAAYREEFKSAVSAFLKRL